MTKAMTGARMVVQALIDQGVDVVFGYPGGAVLPIYDEIFQQNHIKHVLVRHEQAAVHAAEGYARSTGKPGVALVTSGPGATNAVTGLTDAGRVTRRRTFVLEERGILYVVEVHVSSGASEAVDAEVEAILGSFRLL